uniref:Uncharacterized protein n=1 Tax=Anguilla anguilla TaxID=7936 RepID=A0A0E9R5E1_ANGAN
MCTRHLKINCVCVCILVHIHSYLGCCKPYNRCHSQMC